MENRLYGVYERWSGVLSSVHRTEEGAVKTAKSMGEDYYVEYVTIHE